MLGEHQQVYLVITLVPTYRRTYIGLGYLGLRSLVGDWKSDRLASSPSMYILRFEEPNTFYM